MGEADIAAVILAGGLGTRLRALVADRPKPLAAIHGQPFIYRLLDQLDAGGVRHVVLATGYRGEQVRQTLGATYRSLRLTYSQEPEPLGTGGAVRLALSRVHSETVLVLNGDSYCGLDVAEYRRWFGVRGAAAALACIHVSDTSPYGRVIIDDNDMIRAFEEKRPERRPGWINAGVYVLSTAALAQLPAGPSSLERDVFPSLLGSGLHAFRTDARFLDIGTPESYRSATEFFAAPPPPVGERQA